MWCALGQLQLAHCSGLKAWALKSVHVQPPSLAAPLCTVPADGAAAATGFEAAAGAVAAGGAAAAVPFVAAVGAVAEVDAAPVAAAGAAAGAAVAVAMFRWWALGQLQLVHCSGLKAWALKSVQVQPSSSITAFPVGCAVDGLVGPVGAVVAAGAGAAATGLGAAATVGLADGGGAATSGAFLCAVLGQLQLAHCSGLK